MVEKILRARCMSCNIQRVNERGVVTPMSGDMPHVRRIIDAASALTPDDPGFRTRVWDSNIGVLCYRNGLYDFRKGRFFTYAERPDVLPRQLVPMDFPARPEPAVFAELMERVLLSTWGSHEKISTYLALVARAMAGEYTDKQFAVLFGERNSGKGLLQTLNERCYGPYVNTINANSFLLQNFAAADAAKSLSWILDCEFSRLTYTNEVKCNKSVHSIQLDGNLLKSFQSGGDYMSARRNHENEQSFRIGSKLMMNLNDIPTVSPPDAMSTMLLFKFPFKFVDAATLAESSLPCYRPLDNDLKSEYLKRPEVLAAFTWMVIDAYQDAPVVPCPEVLADTKEYLEDIGDDRSLMSRFFVATGRREDFVLLKDLSAIADSAGISMVVLKDRLVKFGGKKDDNCCVGGVRNGRGYSRVRAVQ
jgi:hypothetical protein